MDLQPTPFPEAGKSQPKKKKISKNISKKPPTVSEKRVFGNARSTNVPVKTTEMKSVIKSSSRIIAKQSKSSKPTESSQNPNVKAPQKTKPSEKVKKKNSDPFRENSVKVIENSPTDNAIIRTPTFANRPSLSKIKSNVKGTPYHSAEDCSKCRFDRLETASYWLQHIKLAESVGKHFVSASFFSLAYQSNAEPFRNLLIELKRYLTRHGHLSDHTEWREVCSSYGLVKEKPCTDGAVSSSTTENISGQLEVEKEELKQDLSETV